MDAGKARPQLTDTSINEVIDVMKEEDRQQALRAGVEQDADERKHHHQNRQAKGDYLVG